jgi:glycerol-3-phosphate dehydrogenase
MKIGFPSASKELIHGGTCYAVGEYTACVFHAMRAAEIGLRAVAKHLKVQLSIALELAEWNTLIDLIDKHIKSLMGQPRTQIRDEEIKFFSDANSQFTNFKEAFRKHVAHARDSYEEVPSISILHRTREFLEALSSKVAE